MLAARAATVRATTMARRRAAAGDASARASTLTAEHWRFLAEAGFALDESASVEDLEATVLGLAVPRLADVCVVRLRSDLALALEAPPSSAHARPELLPLLQRSSRGGGELLPPRHPAERVLATGEPDWGDVDAQRLAAVARDAEHLARLRVMGPTSAIVVPLASHGRTLGSLALVATRHSARRYTAEDLAVASELARRVAANLERRAQQEVARHALQEQRDRLATTSHDLKDPLSTIQLALEMVRDQAFDTLANARQVIRAQLDAAASAAARMRRLVEGTLDDLRGEPLAECAAVPERSTRRMLAEIIDQFMPQAIAGEVELDLVADDDLPPIALEGDAMQRALANLIGNAMRFTPAGGQVVVGASATTERTVLVTVSDTGPGIAAEDQPKLFTPGWKRGRLGARAGSGLGLTIARRIVRAAGGELGYRASPGGGATFWMTIPARECSA
jgi:signal transduction histidine kinase